MKGQATSTLLDKNLHVNSSVEFIHSLQIMYQNRAVSLLLVKSSLYSHLNSRKLTESKRKLPRGFDAAFFKTVVRVVKKLCRLLFRVQHFNSVNSSLTYVFHLADFVDISYLTRFAISSLVTFAELCILLCYEVFVLKFR